MKKSENKLKKPTGPGFFNPGNEPWKLQLYQSISLEVLGEKHRIATSTLVWHHPYRPQKILSFTPPKTSHEEEWREREFLPLSTSPAPSTFTLCSIGKTTGMKLSHTSTARVGVESRFSASDHFPCSLQLMFQILNIFTVILQILLGSNSHFHSFLMERLILKKN